MINLYNLIHIQSFLRRNQAKNHMFQHNALVQKTISIDVKNVVVSWSIKSSFNWN